MSIAPRNGETHPISALAGIGLRFPHLSSLEQTRPSLGLLEIHAENLLGLTPALERRIERLRSDYALSLHGVGLSLGSADGVSTAHLSALDELVGRYQPALVSEHLCWNRYGPHSLPDLLPLPMTCEALDQFASNVRHVQDVLRRSIAIENISRYVRFERDEMTEAEFLCQLVQRTGCGVLLDLNNLHVNQLNLGETPENLLLAISPRAVVEYHLAGASMVDGAWIDTHAAPVAEPVWRLYQRAVDRIGVRPTIVEWDQELPPLERLVSEAHRATIINDRFAGRHEQ